MIENESEGKLREGREIDRENALKHHIYFGIADKNSEYEMRMKEELTTIMN